jgi:phosphoribosylformimino-5-aminoimidazole carboxamide ribotide isomerase
VSVEIEVGGGIRDARTVETLLGAGVNCAVIGTRALEDPAFLASMVRAHGDRIIVGADARNGFLATRGWTNDTTMEALPFLRQLRDATGVGTVIFTDIARDGMFSSPNLDALCGVLDIVGLEVIASGGVGAVADVRALRALNRPNLRGVIVGKALYDGRVSLEEAILAAAAPA